MEAIRQPWPWYVAGTLIGLTVPILLLLGNKHFGVSSALRHICTSCFPANIRFFNYNWKKEAWNLFFVAGILVGGWVATSFLADPNTVVLSEKTVQALTALNVTTDRQLMQASIFNFSNLFTVKGLVFFVIGGFLVGFGTRYAGGCTSGHSIMGLSTLQWPSLIATALFFLGGIIVSNWVLPYILQL